MRKNIIIVIMYSNVFYGRHNVSRKSVTTSGLYILMHDVISLPDAMSFDQIESNIHIPVYPLQPFATKNVEWLQI